LQYRTSFSSFEVVSPFKCILGNADLEQEFWTLYKQVTHGGEISDDHFLSQFGVMQWGICVIQC